MRARFLASISRSLLVRGRKAKISSEPSKNSLSYVDTELNGGSGSQLRDGALRISLGKNAVRRRAALASARTLACLYIERASSECKREYSAPLDGWGSVNCFEKRSRSGCSFDGKELSEEMATSLSHDVCSGIFHSEAERCT